jgi:hypothetical protein
VASRPRALSEVAVFGVGEHGLRYSLLRDQASPGRPMKCQAWEAITARSWWSLWDG